MVCTWETAADIVLSCSHAVLLVYYAQTLYPMISMMNSNRIGASACHYFMIMELAMCVCMYCTFVLSNLL